MKIKTITCHDVYNYGASLQAYALQQYLISKGHSVEIIDYKPDYICRKYNFWHVYVNNKLARICIRNFILRFIYCLIYAPVRYRTWQRIFAFNSFTKKHLKLTRRYKNLEELKKFTLEEWNSIHNKIIQKCRIGYIKRLKKVIELQGKDWSHTI